MQLSDPTFPPLLRGLAVDSQQSTLSAAFSGIANATLGAGDVVWSRDMAQFAMAIVLEPEVGRQTAGEMLFLAMVALGDALGALVPAELPITYLWPGTILAQGAKVGEARLVMGPDGSDGAPRFLIVDLTLTLNRDHDGVEPGHDLDHTSLHEEGCFDLDRTKLIESVSRHFMVWMHRWNEEGFAPVHAAWLFRADHYREQITIDHDGRALQGTFTGLDEHGSLLLTTGSEIVRLDTLSSSAMVAPELLS